jgi:hypothetical protein
LTRALDGGGLRDPSTMCYLPGAGSGRATFTVSFLIRNNQKNDAEGLAQELSCQEDRVSTDSTDLPSPLGDIIRMKPDTDYLKELLTAFQNATEPTIDIRDLARAGLSYEDPKFEFHLLHLRDQGLITDDRDGNLGILRGADGTVQWSVIPLRLTPSGHQF